MVRTPGSCFLPPSHYTNFYPCFVGAVNCSISRGLVCRRGCWFFRGAVYSWNHFLVYENYTACFVFILAFLSAFFGQNNLKLMKNLKNCQNISHWIKFYDIWHADALHKKSTKLLNKIWPFYVFYKIFINIKYAK